MFQNFEEAKDGAYKCKDCGQSVNRGLLNFVDHAEECFGKDYFAVMKAYAQISNGRIELSEVERIKSETLQVGNHNITLVVRDDFPPDAIAFR